MLVQRRTRYSHDEFRDRYRRLVANAPDIIYRFDLEPQPGFSFVNDSATVITGYTPEEHYADPNLGRKIVHVEDLPLLDQLLQNKEQFNTLLEIRWQHKNGQTIWIEQRNVPVFDSNGSLIAIEGIARDITDRRRTEAALRRSEAMLRAVFDSFSDILIVVDAGGIITAVNRSSAVMGQLIFEHEPQIGELFYPCLYPSQQELVRQHIDTALQGCVISDELCYQLHNTDQIFISTTYKPVIAADEEIIGVCITISNITEHRRHEEQIRQLNADLERRVRERTAELDTVNRELEAFSYSVSHDLRAPLRSMDGFSLALLEDYNDQLDETGKDYLRRVRMASQNMARLIDDLLSLAQVSRSELNRVPVNLSLLAHEIAEELRQSQPERHGVFTIADGLVTQGDERLLRVALQNLLGNAWKFTSKRPFALIQFGSITTTGTVTVFFVRDNGAGFDMTYASKLFGAFQRFHNADEFPGTGIGLATVQRIIRRHGGWIWAEGTPDKGATFWFTL